MKLYEIDNAILECIDLETGEVIDAEKLSELQMERETKLENVALWIKDLKAEITALKAEKEAFAEREKQAKTKLEGLEKWLAFALNGEKFSTSKVAVSFRKSEAVDVQNEEILPKKYFNKKTTYTVNKTAIKEAIKAGLKVKGAELIENMNLQVK